MKEDLNPKLITKPKQIQWQRTVSTQRLKNSQLKTYQPILQNVYRSTIPKIAEKCRHLVTQLHT